MFRKLNRHFPTNICRVQFATPNQKGTTSDPSQNSTETPKKISSTTSVDKQSSATSIKRPLTTQKWKAPGDTFEPKVTLVEETTIGYVHDLSHPRRNRGNTLDYCTFLFQTATKNVCCNFLGLFLIPTSFDVLNVRSPNIYGNPPRSIVKERFHKPKFFAGTSNYTLVFEIQNIALNCDNFPFFKSTKHI